MEKNLAKKIISFFFRPADVEEKDYVEFYKALTKDQSEPLAKTHFVAEGEVSFKSLLFIPKVQPSESFNKYGTVSDNIKVKSIVRWFLNFYIVIYILKYTLSLYNNYRVFIVLLHLMLIYFFVKNTFNFFSIGHSYFITRR